VDNIFYYFFFYLRMYVEAIPAHFFFTSHTAALKRKIFKKRMKVEQDRIGPNQTYHVHDTCGGKLVHRGTRFLQNKQEQLSRETRFLQNKQDSSAGKRELEEESDMSCVGMLAR